MSQRSSILRREFLRGAGGVAIGLPFLSQTQRSVQAAPGSHPQRLVVVFHGEGTMLDRFTPTSVGSNFELSPLLQPLTTHKQKLTVISGLDNKVASAMGGNGHNKAGRSIVTAQTFSNAPNGGGDNGDANGPSIDQVIASRIQEATRLKSVGLGISCSGVGEYQIFYAGKDDPVSLQNNPLTAFDSLFSSLPMGGAPAPAPTLTLRDRLRAGRGSILDTVAQNFDALVKRVGKEDRDRLVLHAEKIRELERLSSSVSMPPSPGAACGRPDLGLAQGFNVCDADQEPLVAKAQMKNAAMALACDVTRVATVQFTDYDSPRFSFLGKGIPGDYSNWHAMIHRDGGLKPGRDDMVFAGMSYYSSQVALLLDELAAIDDGDGQTLLDNTLVLWISEFGEGGSHDTSQIPVVLAGGAGGKLKTGQHLSFANQNRTTNDLFVTMLNIFGGTDTSFGFGGSDLNKGPLPGIA
ncbi:MAG: DUF1552 domain-containing protein [Polyangiaceae bacterium]|nr:DUF1552 domain-containing protein [Polyangiaceae bacterium]